MALPVPLAALCIQVLAFLPLCSVVTAHHGVSYVSESRRKAKLFFWIHYSLMKADFTAHEVQSLNFSCLNSIPLKPSEDTKTQIEEMYSTYSFNSWKAHQPSSDTRTHPFEKEADFEAKNRLFCVKSAFLPILLTMVSVLKIQLVVLVQSINKKIKEIQEVYMFF